MLKDRDFVQMSLIIANFFVQMRGWSAKSAGWGGDGDGRGRVGGWLGDGWWGWEVAGAGGDVAHGVVVERDEDEGADMSARWGEDGDGKEEWEWGEDGDGKEEWEVGWRWWRQGRVGGGVKMVTARKSARWGEDGDVCKYKLL